MFKNFNFIFLLAMVFVLTGCADNVTLQEAATKTCVGFWYGVWHGLILPFSFLISLFDKDVGIYAVYNNGAWYNFGFVLGTGALAKFTSQKCDYKKKKNRFQL